MVRITMEVKGDTRLLRVFRDLSQNGLDEVVSQALDDIAETVIQQAKVNLADNNLTGQLSDSVKVLDKGTHYIKIGTETLQGKILELGRGPVTPVRAKVLHWVDPKTGKDVYSKYSKPVAPSPWLEPSISINMKTIETMLAHRLDQKVK